MISFADQRRRWAEAWSSGMIAFGAVGGTSSVARELQTEIPTEDNAASLKAGATWLM
jgi:hypothetical protein